jgi:CMP/dCMP kinase
VREWMVARQREMGAAGGVVMEGRDIGTKVFPDANVKIFLDADPEVRGERRYRQQTTTPKPQVSAAAATGNSKAAAVLAEMRERDQRDRTRAISPLVAAPDAVVINSTNLSIEDVLARIREVIASRVAD